MAQRLTDASDRLERDIRNGLFTPFLGPGISSLRSHEINLDLYPWRELWLTIHAIFAHLRSGEDQRFFQALIKQRLALRPEINVDSSLSIPGDLTGSLLVRLQVEIVGAAVRLTHYLGTRLATEPSPIHHLENFSVSFGATDDLARDCLDRLLRATDLALEIDSNASERRESLFLTLIPGVERRLESKPLYHKLLALAVILIGENRKLYNDALGRHMVGHRLPVPMEVEEGWAESFGRLRLDTIEWLSNLLWYTLRYWLPCYPTSAELAFELSLIVKDSPPRCPELALAAQALENEESTYRGSRLTTVIGNLVTYCEAVQEENGLATETRAFYYAIAIIMQLQYENHISYSHSRPSLKDRYRSMGSADNFEERCAPPIPIVFTTSFDMILERIFESHELPVHIMFPITRGGGSQGEKRHAPPTWMFRTMYPKSHKLQPHDFVWASYCDDNGMPQIGFEGPIIVKLHGAPTLSIHEPHAEHWFLLSETDYFEILDNSANVPSWLGYQIGRKKETTRSLWFLGYSMTNLESRLDLYAYCKEHRGAVGRRNTVELSTDLYRTSLLEKLQVEQWIGDLGAFPSLAFRSIDDGESVPSAKVRDMLNQLRKLLEI